MATTPTFQDLIQTHLSTSCFILCFTHLPLSCLPLSPDHQVESYSVKAAIKEGCYRRGRLETTKIYFSISGD